MKKAILLLVIYFFLLVVPCTTVSADSGEVQEVIRQPAESGKTMLIVTHEMAFAKAISNRVFT